MDKKYAKNVGILDEKRTGIEKTVPFLQKTRWV